MTKITSNWENVTYITDSKMTCFIYISRKEELSQHKKQKGRKGNGNIRLPKDVNSFMEINMM